MKNQKNYCPQNDIYNMMIRLHARHNRTDKAHGFLFFFEMQEWKVCGYSGSNDTSFSNKRGWSLEGYGCEFKTHWVHVKKKKSYCWDLHGLLLVC